MLMWLSNEWWAEMHGVHSHIHDVYYPQVHMHTVYSWYAKCTHTQYTHRYCKTWNFRCMLISRFSLLEILLHLNFAVLQLSRVFFTYIKCSCLSNSRNSRKLSARENFMFYSINSSTNILHGTLSSSQTLFTLLQNSTMNSSTVINAIIIIMIAWLLYSKRWYVLSLSLSVSQLEWLEQWSHRALQDLSDYNIRPPEPHSILCWGSTNASQSEACVGRRPITWHLYTASATPDKLPTR